ncbi:hypothetical protein WR25_14832 [Diploscapter pachys]|uniref:Uncharacterized protein n=1 Tax=Diploscapter pachys TaxID=2018661 RepID=A0A2A2KMZ8_9BILA|nr:hypothetical protein WR25_14832 [Diploscapter pachys]
MSYQQPGYNPQYGNPYGNQGAPPPGWAPPPGQNQGFMPPPPMPRAGPHYAEQGEAGTGVFDPKYSFHFSDRSIRNAFVRKVFILVTIMLLVVAVMTAIPFTNPETKNFVRTSMGMYWTGYGVFLVTYLALVCCESVRRSFPANLILTAIFTLATGYMTMVGCMGIMFILSMCLLVFGIVAIVATTVFHVRWMFMIYALLASILFMMYLAIDVQMLMGGRKFELSPEDHIFAAVQIFIDIVYIFWMILHLLGGSK